ncbi:uncharacterized protein LOC129587169 isoform X2 [Paramacrobiotus metropolitanus]|uniref:uncharacterized protein LOC129587169 isoform X2 n=1 Tax=Paramacrobiotus metropolitanus TaxID=2943436 RepID=UPI00244597CA|nr:uncharacterized protein LOC129587169 isoform X2 [Paramacrobiotus metropolitanus]
MHLCITKLPINYLRIKMNFAGVIALTACALFSCAVAARTCEQQKAQCAELRRGEDGFHERMLPPKNSPLWPASAADLQKYKTFADQYCRWSTDLGNCRKSLYTSCPAVYKDDVPSSGGWYGADYSLAFGGLCNTTKPLPITDRTKMRRLAIKIFATNYKRSCAFSMAT